MTTYNNTLLEYKGYTGTVQYSSESNIYHGKVIGIMGVISYEGPDFKSLKEDFKDAIDDYLVTCYEEGIKPEITIRESIAI